MGKATDELQRSIYRYMKQKANELEGDISGELKSYQKAQHKYANKEFTSATLDDLMNSIEHSQVVFLGDFHTFDQSSRNLQRIVKTMEKEKTKYALGVEIVQQKYQEVLNQYLNHLITELEFLEEINYHESWRFPWTHYRPFFESARENNIPILALNSEGTLPQRDKFAAKEIASYLEENKDTKLLVLFGELHIIPEKLPREVDLAFKSNLSKTIIHQNLDEVYWKISQKQREKQDQVIVQFDEHEFCLQTSAPWVKYESMIYWYENLCDDPDFDIHEYLIETGMMTLNSSVPDNFHYLAVELSKALNLELNESDLEDFNLFDHYQLEAVSEKVGRLPKKNLSNFFDRLIKMGKSFRIPFTKGFYCSSYSINRISFLVGQHLHDIYCKNIDIHYEKVLIENGPQKKFLYLFHQSLVSYFCSKVINPYRKCDMYQDFLVKEEPHYKIAVSILNQEDFEPREFLKGRKLIELYHVARTLGFYVGEILSESVSKSLHGHIGEFHKQIFNPNLEMDNFKNLLKRLFPEKSFKGQKKRLF